MKPMTLDEIREFLKDPEDEDKMPFESLKKVLRRRYKQIKMPSCTGHKKPKPMSGLRTLKTMFSSKKSLSASEYVKKSKDDKDN